MDADESPLNADDLKILEALRASGFDFAPMRGLGNWPSYAITANDDGELRVTTVHIGFDAPGSQVDLVCQFPHLTQLLIEERNGDTHSITGCENLRVSRIKKYLRNRNRR